MPKRPPLLPITQEEIDDQIRDFESVFGAEEDEGDDSDSDTSK